MYIVLVDFVATLLSSLLYCFFFSGYPDLDQVITLLLGTGMLMGALVAFVLDNIAPGGSSA